jgi:Tfp pilus assembly protein PilF
VLAQTSASGEPAKTARLSTVGNLFTRKPAPTGNSQPPAKEKDLKPAEAARACLKTADELAQHGHRREAIMLYERAQSLDPKVQVSRFLAVLYDQENSPEAFTEFNRALAASPKDADLLNDFGYYYYKRGDLTNAEQQLRAALSHSPRHEHAWVNLGMVLGEQGRYRESFEAFSKVVSQAAAHSNLGMILAKNGHLSEAQKEFRQALALEPNLEQPRALLAYMDETGHSTQTANAAAHHPAPKKNGS